MKLKLTVPDRSISSPEIKFYYTNNTNFPIACIGKDSYMWNSTINTGIEFTLNNGCAIHNLQIGSFVSIAEGVEFCMGINHN